MTSRMRGADLLAKTLKLAGITRVFSLSGNQIMPVYDACLSEGIRIVHTRHEAAALYMAEGHAQLTGETGIALVTAGAGAANAMGPLLTASESETPILLLTGDSPIVQDGKGAFQEMQQVAMTSPLTKLSLRPERAADMGHEIARALRIAQSGKPGPVHVSLAFDVLESGSTAADFPESDEFLRQSMAASDQEIAALTQVIGDAQRPVILCGPSMNATRFPDIARLADTLDAPVIQMESPRGLKDPSLGDIGKVMQKADLVVSLGKRVDFTLSFGKVGPFSEDAPWVTVFADTGEDERASLNLGERLKLAVSADPRDVATVLIEAGMGGNSRAEWRAEVVNLTALRAHGKNTGKRISSQQLCEAVQRQINKADDPVLICDGGEFGQWAQACCSAPLRVINGASGAIGGGLCYGIAAALARPDATVVSLMGDGTVGFHLAEFETAVRENIPFIAVIGNDMRWNAEHQIQLREYGSERLIGCQLSEARYDKAVAALGGHGEYVTELNHLEAALERAIASKLPACVNVMIDGLPAPSGAAH